MNNGVNENNNQVIPGVKVVMPTGQPVDATTADVGAAVSNSRSVVANIQPDAVSAGSQTAGAILPSQPQVIVQQVQPSAPVQQVSSPQIIQNQSAQVVQSAAVVNNPANSATQAAAQTGSVVVKSKKKSRNKTTTLLFLLIVILVFAFAFMWYYHQQQMALMALKCTPVSTDGKSKELDLDSTVVMELYNKVKTTISEDLAQSQLNDELKIYLAYRQIPRSKFFESRCNMFDPISMEPFTCQTSTTFTPLTFKESDLQLEIRKMFGEDANIVNQNIQLGNSCVGGFQYIEKRGEYVQGQCKTTGSMLYRADKKLVDAVSNNSTIVLTEEVKYYGSEGLEVPARLISGKYKYTFKLDMNYNYIYVSKVLSE